MPKAAPSPEPPDTSPATPPVEPAPLPPQDPEAELLKMLGVASLDEAEGLIAKGRSADADLKSLAEQLEVAEADGELGARTRGLMRNLGFDAFEGLEKAIRDAAEVVSKAKAASASKTADLDAAAAKAGVADSLRGGPVFLAIAKGEKSLAGSCEGIAFMLNTGSGGCAPTAIQESLITRAVAMRWAIDLRDMSGPALSAALRERLGALTAGK